MLATMLRRRRLGRLVATLALATASAACGALLGVDDVAYGPEPSGGDGAADGSGGSDAANGDRSPADGGSAARYRAAVLADAPLAYFRLSDAKGSACKNEVVGEYSARYIGEPVFRQAGVFADQGDNAVHFQDDGVQIVVGGDAAHLDFPHAAPFTFECWLKVDVDGGAGVGDVFNVLQLIPSFSPTLGSKLFVWNPAQIRIERWSGGALWAQAVSIGTALDAFHHFVVTTNATGPIIYVDGIVAQGAGGSALDEPPNDAPFVFGRLKGTLDEVAIYDHVLSLAQVTAHYRAAQ